MTNTSHVADSATPGADRTDPPRRTAAAWAGLAVLAACVMVVGIFVGLLGPLLAVSCSTCQDGIRHPLLFEGALFAVAWGVVPITTLGTVVGLFLRRGGARVGAVGLGVLGVLLVVMLMLGQYSA